MKKEEIYEEYAPMYASVYDRLESEIWRIEPNGSESDAKYELVEKC